MPITTLALMEKMRRQRRHHFSSLVSDGCASRSDRRVDERRVDEK
jgi:hypothetical protein